MDWNEVMKIVTAVFSGTALYSMVGKFIERRDKRAERRQGHDELARSELRHAYANFFAAQTRYVELMQAMVHYTYRLNRAEERNRARQPALKDPRKTTEEENHELLTRVRALQDNARIVKGDAALRLAECIMLEIDAERQVELAGILETPIIPDESASYEELVRRMNEQGERLGKLIKSLTGTFHPKTWHAHQTSRIGETKALSAKKAVQ